MIVVIVICLRVFSRVKTEYPMPDSRRRRRNKRLPEEPVEVTIESLSAEGRGIAHVEKRTVFIDQALPGEQVEFVYTRLTSKTAEGKVTRVIKPSPDRVEARCEVFGTCGGCSLQHMTMRAQLLNKQNTLVNQLQHIGKVAPLRIFGAVTGPEWNYRQKARLGVRYVAKKNKVLVGFRERNSSFITDMSRCEILHQDVGSIIGDLSACIGEMQLKQHIPQIEVAAGDNQVVLVFRHLKPLPEPDKKVLRDFALKHNLVIYLQAGTPEDLELLYPDSVEPLFYELPGYNLRIEFQPSDFTQVNAEINRGMIDMALNFLNLNENDRVLDLFCGLGNFSLPIATRCAHVTGVEGSDAMVNKARENAAGNNIDNIEFIRTDLYGDELGLEPWMKKSYSKILLDPPRSGADAVMRFIGKMKAEIIVYVSCHPATLARDANYLVNQLGYKLSHAGILNMFPHTAHVESMAVFER